MSPRPKLVNLVAVLGLVLLVACQPAPPAPGGAPAKEGGAAPAGQAAAPAAKSAGPTRITFATTNILDSADPFTHSDTFLYPIFCEVIGCLVGWDHSKGVPIPMLAESWKVENPTTWVFNLRKGVKYSDGTPLTSADVAYSIQRAGDHPRTRQTDRVRLMAKVETPDDNTVRITTKEPNTGLLDRSFVVGLAIASKAQADRGDDLSKVMSVSAGPYMLKEWIAGQRVVLAKNPTYWGGPVQGPDEVVLRVMREPEVRVTALLNGEVQIAEGTPQLAERIKSGPNVELKPGGTLTIMFVAMNPLFKPWDNKLARQAVAYAIDRDSIIQNILKGYAEKLEGPIAPGAFGYNPDVPKLRYTYNPDKARQLLAQAGYPNGIEVENVATVGNYVADKEINEAIAAMLTAVGLRMTISTPEQAKRTADFEAGKLPFYYQQRGSVRDPGGPLAQYMETGATKRLNYSNPKLDELFQKERATFNDDDRKKLLWEIDELIQEEVPMFFLWRHKLLWGVSKSLDWTPRNDEAFYPSEVRVR